VLTEKSKIVWVYVLTALFLAANFYLILEKNFYWLFLLPVVLVILYYYIVSLDKIVLFITFLTPLAVNIQLFDMGLAVSLPTEPLMFGVLLVFLAKVLFEHQYDKHVATHPVSYVIYLGLFWMFLTSFTSELPVVSIKHFISRLWFVVPFYFVTALMFRDLKNIHRFNWLYMISLTGIIFYTLSVHARFGFDEETGHWVMSPFYNDHTAYGAAIAIFFPFIVAYIFYPNESMWKRMAAVFLFVVYTVAIILSYSRAAWLSIFAAFGVFVLVMLKIKFRWIVITLAVLLGIFFSFQHQIIDRLEKNKQDSSANFVEHVRSITNISSDASNLERINRWQSALRLYRERPVFGWGPGTYQFVYAPFQRSKEKTIISTNLGDKGNAHSEYLGPLSEEGLPGMLLVFLLVGYIIYTGLMVYKRGNREVKFISMAATLGIITYYAHGFLNNFLDTDKLSVPVWGFTAIIVSLDVYYIRNKERKQVAETKE